MPLINCEISLQLKCLKTVFQQLVLYKIKVQNFKITDPKLYVPVVTLSTQDNIKLLKKLESGFERTINWNKYITKKQIKCEADI